MIERKRHFLLAASQAFGIHGYNQNHIKIT